MSAIQPTAEAEVTTRTCRFKMGGDGIVRARVLAGAEMVLADAQENIGALREVSGGLACPILIDMRDQKFNNREARVFFKQQLRDNLTAIDLLSDSPLSRMQGNFFIGTARQRCAHSAVCLRVARTAVATGHSFLSEAPSDAADFRAVVERYTRR